MTRRPEKRTRISMMQLLKNLHPDETVRDIRDYDFETAWKEGRRLILFDIDNTFVPHGAPADKTTLELMKKLKEQGFQLCAISNNKKPRVKMFCDAAGVPYVFSARKPSGKGYQEAMDRAGVSPKQTLFFGDQIFTDMLGANRAGVKSVLVKPVDLSTDEIQIRLKRILEKPFRKPFAKRFGRPRRK